jgi:hypothetical protein
LAWPNTKYRRVAVIAPVLAARKRNARSPEYGPPISELASVSPPKPVPSIVMPEVIAAVGALVVAVVAVVAVVGLTVALLAVVAVVVVVGRAPVAVFTTLVLVLVVVGRVADAPVVAAALAGVAVLVPLLAAVLLAVLDALAALVEPVSPSLHPPSNSNAVASSSVR